MLSKERERLVKLLRMAHSTSDGEALAAIRKCNDMLLQHKLSWNDVVAQHGSSRPQGTPREGSNPFRGPAATVRASRAFEASIRREKYLEKVRRTEKSAALQVCIAKVPVLLRLAFFPVWAAAAMLAKIVIPEVSTPLRALKLAGATLVVAACGVAWWQIFDVAMNLFQDLDSATPMELQTIVVPAGGLSTPLFAFVVASTDAWNAAVAGRRGRRRSRILALACGDCPIARPERHDLPDRRPQVLIRRGLFEWARRQSELVLEVRQNLV
jgi:hypothetical protein